MNHINLSLPPKAVHRLLVLLEREGKRLSARSGSAGDRRRLRELARWARLIREQRRWDSRLGSVHREIERQQAISDAQRRIAPDRAGSPISPEPIPDALWEDYGAWREAEAKGRPVLFPPREGLWSRLRYRLFGA